MFQRKNSSASDHQPKGRSSSSSRLSNVLGLASTTMSSRSRSTSELLTTEPIGVRYFFVGVKVEGKKREKDYGVGVGERDRGEVR